MTKNRSIALLLLVIVLVNLVLGEGGKISQLAAGARFQPTEQQGATQWAQGPGMGNADASLHARPGVMPVVPPSQPMAAAQPESARPLAESQLPRVELLYAN